MRKLRINELNRLDVETYKATVKYPITVILDDVRSALNVGSVFRTMDAFAMEQLILCGITATPPHREIQKTAIGATESVSWSYEESIITAVQRLKSEGYTIIGVEQIDKSIALNDFDASQYEKTALIFGNEVDGINVEVLPHLDQAILIPQFGTKHSLNIAVCAGILLWEFTKQRLHQT